MKKPGFTIIELMAVVAILGILIGMVMSATTGAIKLARKNKAEASVKCVQQGIETYRAQKDEWPGGYNTESSGSSNTDGVNNTTNADRVHLDASEVRAMVKDVVEETCQKGNPMMDVSGLYVSRGAGESGGEDYGLDFMEAVHGTEESQVKMSISEMYFGYPEESNGYFRRFKIVYSRPTDSIEVSKQ